MHVKCGRSLQILDVKKNNNPYGGVALKLDVVVFFFYCNF